MIRNHNLCGRRFPLQLGVALVFIGFQRFFWEYLCITQGLKFMHPIIGKKPRVIYEYMYTVHSLCFRKKLIR